jgi:hypothetical protein
MKSIKKSLIYAFAIIGVLAVIYGGWTFYQRKVAEDERRAFFSATPAPGTPDFMHAKPHPPPQP